MTGHQIAKKTNHKKTNKTKKEKMEPKTVMNALEETNQQLKQRQMTKPSKKERDY